MELDRIIAAGHALADALDRAFKPEKTTNYPEAKDLIKRWKKLTQLTDEK